MWDAITNPARLSDWWLPADADITVDRREGGHLTFVISGDEPATIVCEILSVEPPNLLELASPQHQPPETETPMNIPNQKPSARCER